MSRDARGRSTAAIWSNHIDAAAHLAQKAVKDRGRPMRENRTGTARQNRREQMPVSRQKAVPDGVDPLLDAMEAPGRRSLSGQIPVEVRQLPEGNEAVLPIR